MTECAPKTSIKATHAVISISCNCILPLTSFVVSGGLKSLTVLY